MGSSTGVRHERQEVSSTVSPRVKGSSPVRGNFYANFFPLIQFWQIWQNDLFMENLDWCWRFSEVYLNNFSTELSSQIFDCCPRNFLIQEKQNGNVFSTSHWIRLVVKIQITRDSLWRLKSAAPHPPINNLLTSTLPPPQHQAPLLPLDYSDKTLFTNG